MLRRRPQGESGEVGAALVALVAGTAIAFATISGGCSTVQTPLPDIIRPPGNASLSDKERKQAVDELTKKRDTHEQDAEQQIEQSR
jgi:hypothetical protein